jgi:hypothetical protein
VSDEYEQRVAQVVQKFRDLGSGPARGVRVSLPGARAEIVGDAPLAKAVLWRAYELQNENLVRSYIEKYPDQAPKWDAFMDAAEEHNTLEALGISAATGVPEPERPQALGRGGVAVAKS